MIIIAREHIQLACGALINSWQSQWDKVRWVERIIITAGRTSHINIVNTGRRRRIGAEINASWDATMRLLFNSIVTACCNLINCFILMRSVWHLKVLRFQRISFFFIENTKYFELGYGFLYSENTFKICLFSEYCIYVVNQKVLSLLGVTFLYDLIFLILHRLFYISCYIIWFPCF